MRTTDEPIRVLHVDDDAEFAAMTATFLEREDDRFDVETATSADEGLRRIDDADCVVSDYDMPGRNGVELLEAVRAERPDLPFILFTGKGSEEVASDAISAGVTDYFQKERGTDQYALLANKIRNAVERARVEQARERHLEAIETAHEGISILNEDGEFIYVNEVYADLYDYEPEELLGEHWSVTYPDEEMEFARSEIMGTIDERGYWHGETVGVRADGSTFPEDHVVSETPHGDLVCTVLDLSDRREREAELRWKTRAMDEAPVGISITDPSQDDNPLIYVNDRFEELTGYDASDIVGRNCRLLQGEGTETEPVAAMREAVDAEESVTVELRNYRADGAEFWNRVKIAPVTDENGELTHFVGFQEDVTERKERERELKAKNERLDEFASIVSHDLRNPLQIAAGRIDLAREECDSDHLDDAANAVERSQALIDDLLVLAREGEELGAVEPVALASLVEDCWRNVATGEATLRLDTDRTIRADRSRLQQLLENLIGNAVEHGGEDVHVTVGDLDDGFYVADDGPGIPDDVRDEVFEAGYSTRTESTGFGLAIVEGVVDAHGWDVGVTESEHDGARFEITGVESVPQESTPS